MGNERSKPFGCSVTTFLRHLKRRAFAAMDYGRIIDANPECGDCTACCRAYKEIVFRPDADKHPELYEEGVVDGEVCLVIPVNEDRVCKYLGDNGCAIYAKRPADCRLYDCRAFAAAGLGLMGRPEVNEAVSQWDVRGAIRSKEDLKICNAYASAAQELVKQGVSAEEATIIGLLRL